MSIGQYIKSKRVYVVGIGILVLAIAGGTIYLNVFKETPPGELIGREIAKLEKLVEQSPGNPDSRVQLALLYLEAGSLSDAISSLEAALQINESHQGALTTLADVYVNSGRYEKAVEYYSTVVELNADNPMRGVSRQLEGVYYHLGMAYFNLGDYPNAIDSFEEAVVIDKTDADAWYSMGLSYQHLGEAEQAIEAFNEAVRFVPDFQEAYEGLARSYETVGNTALAGYAGAMADLCSGYSAAVVDDLLGVIAQVPDYAEAYLGLGLAYEQSGQMDKAIEAYQQALQLQPELWLAQMKVQVLAPVQD